MIDLTRIDGRSITVNADEIETVETSFDSTITFVSGRRIVVKESSEHIKQKVIAYKRSCLVSEKS
ncbi:MAG TPA: flagellar FlbD family protein [Candidatus Kapabacteria bacterium]|jgi:flagellar protein FlbD|nr:flagellar FlbD family protein [Ignavibacteria bacterium]HRE58085.1 flagellar FlbD family protein [Candidatus Kapabacteria bacterium]HRI29942.1 flagellar FlbD family protein [Candidatus Kapabacteria bacterium]HRK58042.1 flagellar FlbD family protein [Candidatus Kapabacteria bacterium]